VLYPGHRYAISYAAPEVITIHGLPGVVASMPQKKSGKNCPGSFFRITNQEQSGWIGHFER
jgi:hypothetical protein